MTSMTAPQPIQVRHLLPWMAVIAVILVVAAIVLSGSDTLVPTRSAPAPGPAAEVVAEPVPSFVAEGIVFGELAPGTQSGAAILPVYMVESIIYGEMDPPTG
jgi:hypothetical protein